MCKRSMRLSVNLVLSTLEFGVAGFRTQISISLFIFLFASTLIGEYFYFTTHEFSALLLSFICGTTIIYYFLALLKKSAASAIPPASNPIPNKNRTQSKGLLKLVNAKKKATMEPNIAPIHSKPIKMYWDVSYKNSILALARGLLE